MNSRILSGVPKGEVEKVREYVQRLLADPALEYVVRAIRLQKKTIPTADYDSPSWAYKQAHFNGYNQAIEDVLKLITIKE